MCSAKIISSQNNELCDFCGIFSKPNLAEDILKGAEVGLVEGIKPGLVEGLRVQDSFQFFWRSRVLPVDFPLPETQVELPQEFHPSKCEDPIEYSLWIHGNPGSFGATDLGIFLSQK